MGKGKQNVTLAEYIINETAKDAYRAGKLTGSKHMQVTTKLLEAVGGLKNLLEQARFLEENTDAGRSGKIKVDWCQVKTDIRKIHYEISAIPELCKLAGREDERAHQLELISKVEFWKKDAAGYDWLSSFYDDILKRLAEGKRVSDAEDELRFKCINAIAKLKEPVWERVFSARVFDNSKVFEKEYRQKMVTILKRYSPYYEENMEDYNIEESDTEDEEKKKAGLEVLKMHGILSYAQTLEWKGPLQYQLNEETIIDTAQNIYGTIINTQTLEHAIPIALSGCKKIMTIENKANYESMQYAEDTLYIFCHGYLTPKEVYFLKQLCRIVPEDCIFYHWGDMDFGGISIFQFIKENVFPELIPYKMGTEDFYEALQHEAGIPLKASTRAKLEKKEAGLLTDLKEAILETGKTIEQERLL